MPRANTVNPIQRLARLFGDLNVYDQSTVLTVFTELHRMELKRSGAVSDPNAGTATAGPVANESAGVTTAAPRPRRRRRRRGAAAAVMSADAGQAPETNGTVTE